MKKDCIICGLEDFDFNFEDLMNFFSTDEKPVSPDEFRDFWCSLTDEEKDDVELAEFDSFIMSLDDSGHGPIAAYFSSKPPEPRTPSRPFPALSLLEDGCF